jgi:hypothetical protein
MDDLLSHHFHDNQVYLLALFRLNFNLLITFLANSPCINDVASSEKLGYIYIVSSNIICNFSNLFLLRTLNGLIPDSISYTIRPYIELLHNNLTKLHQSTALLCPLPLTISGARYSGVPQKV